MRALLTCFLLPFAFGLQTADLFAQQSAPLNPLPSSEIDIPIQVALRPFYRMADETVDTVFTSPNYPNDWVLSDCATRYKYRFRRSPLQLATNNNVLSIGFTGFYQIIGSTRACVKGAVLSPWTPGCGCGFEEGERKVAIGFTSTFRLARNYMLNTKITRQEPRALDKCNVCFWGQDITSTVLTGLKKELDLSRKAMEDSFSSINLKPYFQQAWNKLNEVYPIPSLGYFMLHPKQLRMNSLSANKDMLNLSIGITANPTISLARPTAVGVPLPLLTQSPNKDGFSIYLEAAMEYDSLSQVMTGLLAGKRFDMQEGLIRKHIVVQNVTVAGDEKGNIGLKMDFTGSHNGTVYLTGSPVYNEATKTVEVRNMDYDLRTKSLFLKTAKWLFDKRIISELNKYASFDLSQYYDTARVTLNTWLNREWSEGIRGTGTVKGLELVSVQALPQHLLIRSNCTGNLAVQVTGFKGQF